MLESFRKAKKDISFGGTPPERKILSDTMKTATNSSTGNIAARSSEMVGNVSKKVKGGPGPFGPMGAGTSQPSKKQNTYWSERKKREDLNGPPNYDSLSNKAQFKTTREEQREKQEKWKAANQPIQTTSNPLPQPPESVPSPLQPVTGQTVSPQNNPVENVPKSPKISSMQVDEAQRMKPRRQGISASKTRPEFLGEVPQSTVQAEQKPPTFIPKTPSTVRSALNEESKKRAGLPPDVNPKVPENPPEYTPGGTNKRTGTDYVPKWVTSGTTNKTGNGNFVPKTPTGIKDVLEEQNRKRSGMPNDYKPDDPTGMQALRDFKTAKNVSANLTPRIRPLTFFERLATIAKESKLGLAPGGLPRYAIDMKPNIENQVHEAHRQGFGHTSVTHNPKVKNPVYGSGLKQSDRGGFGQGLMSGFLRRRKDRQRPISATSRRRGSSASFRRR